MAYEQTQASIQQPPDGKRSSMPLKILEIAKKSILLKEVRLDFALGKSFKPFKVQIMEPKMVPSME